MAHVKGRHGSPHADATKIGNQIAKCYQMPLPSAILAVAAARQAVAHRIFPDTLGLDLTYDMP